MVVLLSMLLMGCNGGETPTSLEPTSGPVLTEGEDAVRVAVLAIRSAEAANTQYGPILSYLSEEIGRPFELIPVGQEEQFEIVEDGLVDFTMNNPLAAVQIRRLYGTEFLATISRQNTGPEFSALIITTKDSGIETLEDLRGKKVTCVAFQTAAAGCNFQVFHLIQAGISPDEFGEFTQTPSQDNIVLGVLNGTFDVGFIRTGELEKMVAEGTLLSLDEIFIVDQAKDDFFFPHTTRLYPEWPFAALQTTDPELAKQAQEALIGIPADHPALANAKAVGFVPAIDYQPLDELIEQLELRSYDVERK